MPPAFKLGPGIRLGLKNVGFSGFDVAVEGSPGSSVQADGVTFHNVGQPFDMPDSGPSAVRRTRILDDPKLRRDKTSAFVGWRRPTGAALPVFCPQCKSIFSSNNYVFGGPFWESWDNEETCPECGFEAAKVAEGIFNLARETVEILSAPDFTHAMLRTIGGISEQVLSGAITPQAAATEIERVSPSFGLLWLKALKHSAAALAFVATIAAAYYGRESVLLGQKQVEIGMEQVRLQKESNTDALLTQILSETKVLRFTLQGVKNEPPEPEIGHSQASDPAKGKTPAETGSIKLKSERKPKARDLRRKAQLERRRVMKGQRHSGTPK